MSVLADASGSSVAGKIFRRLRDHELLKVLVYLEGEEFKRILGPDHARRLAASKDPIELGQACEAPLAKELGFDPEEVVVHLDDPRHVLYRPDPSPNLDEDINFVTPADSLEPLVDRSELFSALPSSRWWRQLVVYAPIGKRDAPLANRATEIVMLTLRSVIERAST
jgi:hypothetical protein